MSFENFLLLRFLCFMGKRKWNFPFIFCWIFLWLEYFCAAHQCLQCAWRHFEWKLIFLVVSQFSCGWKFLSRFWSRIFIKIYSTVIWGEIMTLNILENWIYKFLTFSLFIFCCALEIFRLYFFVFVLNRCKPACFSFKLNTREEEKSWIFYKVFSL